MSIPRQSNRGGTVVPRTTSDARKDVRAANTLRATGSFSCISSVKATDAFNETFSYCSVSGEFDIFSNQLHTFPLLYYVYLCWGRCLVNDSFCMLYVKLRD